MVRMTKSIVDMGRVFEEYVLDVHADEERALLIKMIRSRKSLPWICKALAQDTRIPDAMASPTVRKQKKSFMQLMPPQDEIFITKRLVAGHKKTKSRQSPLAKQPPKG